MIYLYAKGIVYMYTFQHRVVITYIHYKPRQFNNQENNTPLNFHERIEMVTLTNTGHDVALPVPHKECYNSEEVCKDPDKSQCYLDLV